MFDGRRMGMKPTSSDLDSIHSLSLTVTMSSLVKSFVSMGQSKTKPQDNMCEVRKISGRSNLC